MSVGYHIFKYVYRDKPKYKDVYRDKPKYKEKLRVTYSFNHNCFMDHIAIVKAYTSLHMSDEEQYP